MTATVNENRSFVSDLNKIFALFTVIKLLVSVAVKYWHFPVRVFFFLIGMKDSEKAMALLSSNAEPSGLLINISLYVAAVAVPTALFFALNKGYERTDHKYYTSFPSPLKILCAVGTTFIISYAATFGLYALFQLLLNALGYSFYPPLTEVPTSPDLIPLYVIYLCVIPAFSEEFLSRGLLMRSVKKMGNGFAIIITALFFMMMHDSVSNLSFSFFAGLCLTYFAIRFGSIWVAVIAHFCLNLNAAIIQFMEHGLETKEGLTVFAVYFLTVAIIALTFFLIFVFKFGFILPKENGDRPTVKKRLIFKCPFFYIFILIFSISAVIDVISLFE
ncbi:MAG: CPBP family intramembrane metalloprotease [Clostridia bacterium]|nr:CPBP family intramembrane metalloprotease [Clostridia bacterium]